MLANNVFGCFMFNKGVYFCFLESIEPVTDDEKHYHDAGRDKHLHEILNIT